MIDTIPCTGALCDQSCAPSGPRAKGKRDLQQSPWLNAHLDTQNQPPNANLTNAEAIRPCHLNHPPDQC